MAETSVSDLLANRERKLTMAAALLLGCGACEAVSPNCRPKNVEDSEWQCSKGKAAFSSEQVIETAAINCELVYKLAQAMPSTLEEFKEITDGVIINMPESVIQEAGLEENVDTSMQIDRTLPPPKENEWPWNFQPLSAQELEATKGAVVSGLIDPTRPDIGDAWPWDRMEPRER
jgi:hypothetical protein